MLTAGVDLAAEPKGTALAIVHWTSGSARVVDLQVGVTDEPIVQATLRVDKLGIDCALGWPEEFVSFMTQHADIGNAPHNFDGGMAWRRRLAYRETDRNVREQTGRWPLSVSTDRLGLTAMRCAGLLARLGTHGVDVDRSGAGRIAEVYPGASLRLWGFDTQGYRNSIEARAILLAAVRAEAPWFEPGDFEKSMIESCDAFDAVIAAFAARAAALGRYQHPREDQLAQAATEGWIALPQGPLDSLHSAT